jgi:hypothetical protein
MRKILLTALLGTSIGPVKAQSTSNFYVYGGSGSEETKGAVGLPDGSKVILSASKSSDGDVTG